MLVDFEDNRGWTFLIEEALLKIMDLYFVPKQWFKEQTPWGWVHFKLISFFGWNICKMPALVYLTNLTGLLPTNSYPVFARKHKCTFSYIITNIIPYYWDMFE